MRLRNLAQQVIENIAEDAEKDIERLTLLVENNARKSMKGGGKPHTPSKPFEPPHVDTGRLRASITHEMDRTLFLIIGRVGTNVRYGRDLELGTSRILPRPWLRPALKKVVGQQ